MIAPDESSLERKLTAIGCWLVDAQPASADAVAAGHRAGRLSWLEGWFGGVSRRDMIEFCTLIGFEAKVGIPLI